MSEKSLSVKVFRGTIPEDEERYGEFAGEPGACFRITTEDDAHAKCFHVKEPPFNADHLEDLDKIKSLAFAYLVFPGLADAEVEYDIEDGVYLHKVFNIAYRLRGDNVLIKENDVPYWILSDMDRWHIQMLLDNGLIYKTGL